MSLATRIEAWSSGSPRVQRRPGDGGEPSQPVHHRQVGLVAAINELKAAVLSATAIDDNQIATSTTYSSNKIVSLLDALKADILGGQTPPTTPWWRSSSCCRTALRAWTRSSPPSICGCGTTRRKTLTVAEQLQARTNIGAVAAVDVGNTDTGLRRDLRRGAGLMSLASSIAALAARIGFEVKTKIDATHPGIARVGELWLRGRSDRDRQRAQRGQRRLRTAAGRYRVHFTAGDAGRELLLDGARTQQQQQRPAAMWLSFAQLRPENGPVRRHLLRDDSNVVRRLSEINLVVYR